MERPLSVPLNAPSFMISVNKKLMVLGLLGLRKVLTTWHADASLSNPTLLTDYHLGIGV
jgi:hypothetical protein